MRITLGLSMARSRNPVSSFLAGTKGGIIDFRNRNLLWQDAAGATPVTADAQSIGLARSPGPVAAWEFSQATAGAFPTSGASFAAFDGGDFLFGSPAVREVSNGVAAMFMACRFRASVVSGAQTLIGISTAGFGVRCVFRITSSGQLGLSVRRLDTDTPAGTTSATGLITAGVWYDAAAFVDYAAGTMSLRLGAAEVATGAPPSAGTVEAILSGVVRIGTSTGSTPAELFSGDMAYVVCANKLPTVAEWDKIRGRLA